MQPIRKSYLSCSGLAFTACFSFTRMYAVLFVKCKEYTATQKYFVNARGTESLVVNVAEVRAMKTSGHVT